MKPEIAFGLVLKSIREEKGGSQEILTLDADLDRTFISLLERGRRQPSLSSILALARSLGVPPEELVQRTVERM